MSDNKMKPEFFKTLPWRISARSYMNYYYFLTGKDGDRDLKILEINDGPHPIKEHRDRIRDNSEAIVSAINNTYGACIDPEQVPALLDALKELSDFCERNFTTSKAGWISRRNAIKVIDKAKL